MIMEFSWFLSDLKIGQKIADQYCIHFLIDDIFWRKDFLGKVFIWF